MEKINEIASKIVWGSSYNGKTIKVNETITISYMKDYKGYIGVSISKNGVNMARGEFLWDTLRYNTKNLEAFIETQIEYLNDELMRLDGKYEYFFMNSLTQQYDRKNINFTFEAYFDRGRSVNNYNDYRLENEGNIFTIYKTGSPVELPMKEKVGEFEYVLTGNKATDCYAIKNEVFKRV